MSLVRGEEDKKTKEKRLKISFCGICGGGFQLCGVVGVMMNSKRKVMM